MPDNDPNQWAAQDGLDPAHWTPVLNQGTSGAYTPSPIATPFSGPTFSASLPPQLQYQPTLVKEQYNGRVPVVPTWPQPASGNANANSASQSVSKTVVENNNSTLVTGVSSVNLTMPSYFDVSGGGAGAVDLAVVGDATQTANSVLATPNGSVGALAVRALVGADVPAINVAATGNGGITGILPITHGGNGTASPVLTAGSNVTLTGTWPNYTINASGSPTSAVGQDVQVFSPVWSAPASSYNNKSVVAYLPANYLKNAANTWRVGLWITGGGSFQIGQMAAYQTLAGSTTVLTTVAVTLNSSATPTLTASGNVFYTDPISLVIDNSHDYYFGVYFSSTGTPLPAQGTTLIGSADFSFASQTFIGNNLAITVMPSMSSTATAVWSAVVVS